jgi:GTP-binding protein HflX
VGARDTREIVVFNNADLIDDDARLLLRGLVPSAVFVSSRTGEGIDELRRVMEDALPLPEVELRVLLPYDRGDLVSAVHEHGMIYEETHEAEGTALHARVGAALAGRLEDFLA